MRPTTVSIGREHFEESPVTMTTDLASVDDLLMDPAWYAKNDWHPTFKRLRREDPIHWTDDKRYGHPYWAVTTYDAIREVYERWDLFSSRMGTPLPPRGGRRFTPEERFAMALDVRAPSVDPPVHGLYRRPINKHFSVPAIAKMTEHLDSIIDSLILEAAEKEEFDLVKDVVAQLPVRAVFGLLGVPEEDWASLQASVARYALGSDPEYTIDNDPVKTTAIGAREVDEYASKLALARREDPRDDLASVIGALKIDADKLSLHEMTAWFTTLILGGGETTRNALGNGVWQFLEHPEQRKLVVENEAVLPDAVEEVMRWGSPSRTVLRVANEDLEFHGKEMRTGDWIILFAASGNRDESIWEDPDRFDITRERKENLALGHGIHKCLGRNLARLEMMRFFPKFLSAFPELAMTAAPVWVADYNSNGIHHMPVTHNGVVRR
jgi:cytochrome P450